MEAPEKIVQRLITDAKEEREMFAENMLPVTNDSCICLWENAANTIEQLQKENADLEDEVSGCQQS